MILKEKHKFINVFFFLSLLLHYTPSHEIIISNFYYWASNPIDMIYQRIKTSIQITNIIFVLSWFGEINKEDVSFVVNVWLE